MPAESAYREACVAACEWCASGDKGTPVTVSGVRWHGGEPVDDQNDEGYPCTAPTIEKFAQSQALGRVAAEKRADAAEQELRAWKGALQLECTCDSDVLGRCVLRDAHPDPRVPVLEQERDRLRALLEEFVNLEEKSARESFGTDWKSAFHKRDREMYWLCVKAREALAPAPATVAEEVIDLEVVTHEVARERILSLFARTGGPWVYDRLADHLKLPLRQVVEVCNALEEEGLIGEASSEGAR